MSNYRWMPVVALVALEVGAYGGVAIAGGMTMIELRQTGWVVVEQSERVEAREPLAGYTQGHREVLINEYRLAKDGAVMTCTMAYDNHLDTLTQACVPGQ